MEEIRCSCGKMLGTIKNGKVQIRHGEHSHFIKPCLVLECSRCGESKLVNNFNQETLESTAAKAVDSNAQP
jgi:RNase P subunit RPR2